MTEQGMKTLMDKLPDIYATALINYSYFDEAVRVCERLKETETSFYVDKMSDYLKQLMFKCYCIKDEVDTISKICHGVNGEINAIIFCLIDAHAKEMSSKIDEFEELRNNIFINQDFKMYVEPKMGQYYRNLIRTEDKKQDASTVPAQSDGGEPSQESNAVEI